MLPFTGGRRLWAAIPTTIHPTGTEGAHTALSQCHNVFSPDYRVALVVCLGLQISSNASCMQVIAAGRTVSRGSATYSPQGS
ncbi:hypothetical protein PSPO01_13825 [Paraphaeosphaeria sporulosa]